MVLYQDDNLLAGVCRTPLYILQSLIKNILIFCKATFLIYFELCEMCILLNIAKDKEQLVQSHEPDMRGAFDSLKCLFCHK